MYVISECIAMLEISPFLSGLRHSYNDTNGLSIIKLSNAQFLSKTAEDHGRSATTMMTLEFVTI